MKKLIYCALALAAGLFAASCQQENLEPVAQENTVTYTVELPTVQTKGFMGTVSKVDQLVYEVWKTEKAYERDLKGTTDGKANATRLYQKVTVMPPTQKTVITLNLVQDQEYTILFWAQNSKAVKDEEYPDGTPVYNTENLTDVHYKDVTSLLSNQESYEAYYATEFVSDGDKKSRTVTLKRPFAQLNLGTKNTQMESTGAEFGEGEYGVEVVSSKVTVSKVGTHFNVANNYVATPDKEGNIAVTGDASVTFETETDPSNEFETITVNGETYEYVAMNYLFATGENVTVDYEINTKLTGTNGSITDANVTNIVYEVPLKENYRTNIVGNLLTSSTQYEVIVDASWDNLGQEPPYLVELWDGETISEPEYDETTQTYTITYGSELAWLAAAVNGTLPQVKSEAIAPNAFIGKTFVLSDNIDLGNHNWTPIGTSANPFKGTFDGNGKIIKNLVAHGGATSNIGLFGVTQNGEIKNVTVENANVSGRLNVAVVAGTPYTSKYTNITVKGHVEVNGMAYVGAVGGKNAYADWTNITVNVDETSYVNANSVENGTAYRTYVGGVVGFNGEGGHSFKNITSNINVKGSTCDVGGLFGIAHYSNQFENCVCTGNVEIYAAEEADEAEEIGGIAGVWHNATDYTVTFTNCSFTGVVTTNVERGTAWYGNLIGKPYGDGEGKLVIDGLEFDINGVNFAVINTALATGEGYVFPFDLTGKATASNGYGVTGITHKVGGTIDGNYATLKVNNANATWASALHTKGGVIKNLTVAKGFRGIFVTGNESKVYLENVVIEGPTYTISCDQGLYGGLEAKNSTFNGWTSYAATIGDVYFEGCSFGKGAGYKFCRPYAPTTFVKCDFCEGYEIDARAEVAFIGCTFNGAALTAENLATLVTGNTGNAAIYTVVSTSQELVAALAAGKNVRFKNDITVAATKGGYSKAGILQNKAQAIDGNGHTLTVTGAGATWDCAIYTNGGLIKNLTVAGAMRGIFTAGQSSDLHIDNVIFKNVVYTFNSDGKMPANPFGVYVSNSTVNGWTSHSNMHTEVVYTNCSFGEGSGYKFCRPYGKTSFVNCTFCAGYTLDKSKTTEITETDCTWE